MAVEICNSQDPINHNLSDVIWKSIAELMDNVCSKLNQIVAI